MKTTYKMVNEEDSTKIMWITIDGDEVEVTTGKRGGTRAFKLGRTDWYRIESINNKTVGVLTPIKKGGRGL